VFQFMLVSLIAGLLFGSQGCASSPSQDARIKTIAFQENKVVFLQGKTFTTTQIIFDKDEVVQGVEGGDTSGWIVDYKQSLPNMLFIKPTALGSSSNITVVTNKHSYYFKVSSNKTITAQDKAVTYALRFTYPQANDVKAQADKRPQDYNWHYSFHGNPALKPRHAFDDGTFTYLEFKPNQIIPAVFAVEDAEGKEAVVNTRRLHNYLIIQRLAAQFTLRNGSKVASLFNQEAITRIREGNE
jgi:type IV secretion system protein VirB9